MKKILISGLVALILTFNTFFSYQRAHAFAWVLLAPAAAEAAYVGTMTAVFGGAALATAGINYLDENLDEVEATARETWGLMSQDMKDNFAQSMSQVGDGISVAGNWIEDFLSRAALNPALAPPQSADITGTFRQSNAQFYALSGYSFTYNDRQYQSLSFGFDNATTGRLRISIGGVVSKTVTVGPALFSQFLETASNSSTSSALLATVIAQFGVSVTTSSGAALDLPTGQLDNIRDHINDKIRAEGGTYRLGVPANTLVEPWANTAAGNARVYPNEDGTTDTMVLPDGVPIPRDQVNWRTRATGQATIDGVSVPVAVGADGALYDTRTGERVMSREDAQARGIPLSPSIPREWEWQDTLTKNPAKDKVEDKPISIPGGFAGPTKPIAWNALKMNAQALTTKFPFSIPWDLMRQLKVFDTGPETPVFEINIGDYLKIGEYTIPMNFEVDLSMFDKVAAFIRWFNLILWDIGLVLLIRKLLPE